MKSLAIAFCLLLSFSYGAVAQDSTGYLRTSQYINAIDQLTMGKDMVYNFTSTANTVGTPYLYDGWAYMWLDSLDNKAVQRSVVYEANLDLQKNQLIIKGGDGKAYAPEIFNIQALHFKKGDEMRFFVRAYLNGSMKFVEQLSTAGKYTLLKDVAVVYSKADYVDKGMVQTGKLYNEFKRKYTYYLVQNDKPTKVVLKRKNILAAFDNDPQAAETANKFMEANNGLDETVLAQTVNAINMESKVK